MATKQIRKQTTKETSSSWSALFPTDTTTITGSQVFIKQLTALLFSCITHIRGIFPEYAFDDRVLDDRKVKVLNGNYECKNAYLMTRWLKSAFQALELQYMQTLTLEILTVNNQPLEFYAVDYKYSADGPSCSFYTNQDKNNAIHFSNCDVENATKKLVFALLDATEGLGELPVKYQLQLRIHYYDDRTPASYSPDYFMDAEPCDWDNVQNLKRIKLGSVTTDHHSVTLCSGSTLVPSDGSDQPLFNYPVVNREQQYWEGYNNEAYDFNLARLQSWCNESVIPISSESFNQSIIESEVQEVKYEEESVKPEDSEEFEFIPPSTRQSPQGSLIQGAQIAKLSSSIDLCNSTISVDSADEETYTGEQREKMTMTIRSPGITEIVNAQVKCICSLSDQQDIFKCLKCELGHHKVCYKHWPDATTQVDNTYCYSCAKESNLICLDEHVMQCTDKQAKNLMLFRQLLYKLQYLKKISITKMANDYNLTENQAKKFIKKLSDEGFIKPSLSKDVYIIHSTKLKNYIDQYFRY